ncbi:nucleolar protein 16 [Salminus brasiliensis]|uniref:nucleolar protein 16 n=1 Tax=Salminus brasiliensis TaxID=930266 RepID=UPI003B836044
MGKRGKRNTFNYNTDRKKLKKKIMRKERPTIGCAQIRKAWDDRKSAKQNMQDMGLSFGTKGVLPINKKSLSEPVEQGDQAVVVKPYVIREMETVASLRAETKTTCSNDLTEFVQYMIREHNENYKAMARDEKNYYQHTPKQIKRKVDLYKRSHPQDYAAFIASLQAEKTS